MAENEFFRIIDASKAKQITIKSSANRDADQIASPSKLALVTKVIVATRGKKITKAERKNPIKYPRMNCSREIDLERINSTSLFSKARLILRHTNRIIPTAIIALDDPAM